MASHSASTSTPRFLSLLPAQRLLVAPVTAAVSSYSVNCIGPAWWHADAFGTWPRRVTRLCSSHLALVVPGCGADAPPFSGPDELQRLHPSTAERRPAARDHPAPAPHGPACRIRRRGQVGESLRSGPGAWP